MATDAPHGTVHLVLTGWQRPHEIWLLILSVISGITSLISGLPPENALSRLPGWQVGLWSASLAASGLIGLGAFFWRRRLAMSLMVERGAMLLNAAPLIVYAAAVILAGDGMSALLGGVIVSGWAVADLVRVRQIQRDLKGT